MIHIVIFIIISICTLSSTAQIVGFTKEDSVKPFVIFEQLPERKMEFGFETAGYFVNFRDTLTWEKLYARRIRIEPHVSFYLKNNLGFGLRSRVDFFRSNYLPNQPTLLEFGTFARYYIPFNLNVSFFSRIFLSAELSYSRSNYFINGSEDIFTSKFSNHVFRLPISMHFLIYQGLNLKWGLRYETFLGSSSRLEGIIGLSYIFK